MATSSDTVALLPKPASSRKRAAARANGAKGRGRKSEDGKRASAQNALKHGITSATIVLAIEDTRQYEALRAAYFAWWQPRNVIEIDLLDEMVATKWRQRRAWAIETAALELEIARQRPQVDDEFVHASDDVRTAIAFDAKAAPGGSLPTLLRLEARLSRQYSRALRTLLELRGGEAPPARGELEAEPAHDPQRAPAAIEPAPERAETASAPSPQRQPQQHVPLSASAPTKNGQNEANPDFGHSPRPAHPRFLIRTPGVAATAAAASAAGSSDLT